MAEPMISNDRNTTTSAFVVVAVVLLLSATAVVMLTCGSTTPTLSCASATVATTAVSCVLTVRRILAVLSPWSGVGGGDVIRAWPPHHAFFSAAVSWAPSYVYAGARDDLSGGVAWGIGVAVLAAAFEQRSSVSRRF
ncbi:hypothetical protein E2562_017981 [Oryza meyeriana var. granulata]|uniref:Uncharacterized protein n=1 Tax=Oryza meyeriana var. granulata TaxID=110450 RepID=A0A6G1F945_9ORYZ|nr:hypothetical protein E2562_017981 [Oryza meyeriana var. granulata]